MANLSIRDRIIRQVKAEMAAITGIGSIYRYDTRGTVFGGQLDGYVMVENEVGQDDACGSPPVQRCTMLLSCGVLLGQSAGSSEETDILVNRWILRLKNALLSNRRMTEDSTSKILLMLDFQFAEVGAPELDPDATDISAAYCGIQCVYRHDGDLADRLGGASGAIPPVSDPGDP